MPLHASMFFFWAEIFRAVGAVGWGGGRGYRDLVDGGRRDGRGQQEWDGAILLERVIER